ncbi:MAG: glucosamine 6-phosphate synthetase [Actinomycetota bacterium]
MCGIFGVIASGQVNREHLDVLAKHARQRGRDSSGLIASDGDRVIVQRADFDILKLLKKEWPESIRVALGHSRLITNGLADNQPVARDDVLVLHNGIVVNADELWGELSVERELQIDTEAIAGIAVDHVDGGREVADLPKRILEECRGVVACAVYLTRLGKLLLFSNNGSLYVGELDGAHYFSSEFFPLSEIGCVDVRQVKDDAVILDVPAVDVVDIKDHRRRTEDLIPDLAYNAEEDRLLMYPEYALRRCSRCILPETMPFINFDDDGVCNYCRNYTLRNVPKAKEELFELVEPYRRGGRADCILPFSGGRDSCYGLHLVVNELGMNPITYTYDWGMVTDLGRRNISRMCSQLGVENIIVAADISKKRRNIAMNLKAWLKSPHLGMVSVLTAGDKHFFRHVETVKAQTGIDLNLWGINPLEVTHFKAGFLGVPPNFEEKKVYSHGAMKQLRYWSRRFAAMAQSPGYYNRSLWDTLSGEYYRSFTEKSDYFHIFDYWRWDEDLINDTLIDEYDWETAVDTNATWRIGDGTAAFYNYVYYLAAGFTEHDTFRSNQIREGQMTRSEALELVKDENAPRYENIRWYLDAIGMDFESVVATVNKMHPEQLLAGSSR